MDPNSQNQQPIPPQQLIQENVQVQDQNQQELPQDDWQDIDPREAEIREVMLRREQNSPDPLAEAKADEAQNEQKLIELRDEILKIKNNQK